MYLMQAWFSIFLVKIIFVLLFLYRMHALIGFTSFSLLKKYLIYMLFCAIWPKTMYLALVIEIGTVYYFLLYHNIIVPLIKK